MSHELVPHEPQPVVTVHLGPPPEPRRTYSFVGYRALLVGGELKQVREFVTRLDPEPAEFVEVGRMEYAEAPAESAAETHVGAETG